MGNRHTAVDFMYTGLIRSILDYSTAVYGSTTQTTQVTMDCVQVLFRLLDCDTTIRNGKANDGNTEGTDHTELLGQSTGPQQDQPTQNILKPCWENENNFR